MAKKSKDDVKVSKNPKNWEGYEANHSLVIGSKVRVMQFGVTSGGWEVVELQLHPEFDIPCYKLRAPDGTRWPYVGYWMNNNIRAQIVP